MRPGVPLLTAFLCVLLGACSKNVPLAKATPEIHDNLHCYIAESKRGVALVCAEKPGMCADLQMATVQHGEALGVTAVSGCKMAEVTADAKEE